MEFFNPTKLNFKFSKFFKPFMIFSVVSSLISLVLLVAPGLNYGIDFRGGIEAHVSFKGDMKTAELREVLDGKLENLSIVAFSDSSDRHEYLVTAQADSKESVTKALRDALTAKYGEMGPEQTWNILRMDVVGAKVGANLRKAALLSLIYTCLLITLYMYWRFDMRFSPGALLCIFHDLTFVCGILVLLGTEFSTSTVAALLTLAGYSINDTVVLYDRVREIEGKYLGKTKTQIVDFAINSTLSRTIMTSLTTLLSCAVLYFVAGSTLKDFAFTLFVGIIIGTYSSMYVAAPMYVWADKKFGEGAKMPATMRS